MKCCVAPSLCFERKEIILRSNCLQDINIMHKPLRKNNSGKRCVSYAVSNHNRDASTIAKPENSTPAYAEDTYDHDSKKKHDMLLKV